MVASRNPATWNSSRKAPPSLAPAIQANQLESLIGPIRSIGSPTMSSAA